MLNHTISLVNTAACSKYFKLYHYHFAHFIDGIVRLSYKYGLHSGRW